GRQQIYSLIMATTNSSIGGCFRVASDCSGSFYVVAFWPDRFLTTALAPLAFLVTLTEIEDVRRIIGRNRESSLSKARVSGIDTFRGSLGRDIYERCVTAADGHTGAPKCDLKRFRQSNQLL